MPTKHEEIELAALKIIDRAHSMAVENARLFDRQKALEAELSEARGQLNHAKSLEAKAKAEGESALVVASLALRDANTRIEAQNKIIDSLRVANVAMQADAKEPASV